MDPNKPYLRLSLLQNDLTKTPSAPLGSATSLYTAVCTGVEAGCLGKKTAVTNRTL